MVGEFMGDVGCEIRNKMPIEYSPVGNYEEFEAPFTVHFDKNDVSNVFLNNKLLIFFLLL